jgi:Ulp1 family protease
MKYIFIPIKFGKHYTLVVIYLELCKIHYQNSLNSSPTGSNASYKQKLRQSILENVLTYLKNKHLEIKDKDLPEKWKIVDDPALTPQQENRVDCGVFVCYFMDFILDGCKLDFIKCL